MLRLFYVVFLLIFSFVNSAFCFAEDNNNSDKKLDSFSVDKKARAHTSAGRLDALEAAKQDADILGSTKDISKLHYADLLSPTSVARLKDIADIQNVRSNHLVGYGLVVGLNGTGDSLRNSPFTEQAMRSMLENLGISSPQAAARANNIAAVIVTADLPAFAAVGSNLDVTVSSLGDAKSLQGGNLIMTPLMGPDGKTYAVAQGNLVISGFSASGNAAKLTQGVPTAGRIPNGAIIERALPGNFNDIKSFTVSLHQIDFTTATRVADLINEYSQTKYNKNIASLVNGRTVSVAVPDYIMPTLVIAELESLPIPVDEVAKVVVDERTGTVVIGEKVRISKVAISHGSLTVKVDEDAAVSQPDPFSLGKTIVTPRTKIDVNEPPSQIGIFKGASLEQLVKGLNQIGVKPAGIIAILQAIKTAGALHAKLVVQ